MVEAFTSLDRYGGRSITYTLGDAIRYRAYTLAMKYVNSSTSIVDQSIYIWLFNPSGVQVYDYCVWKMGYVFGADLW